MKMTADISPCGRYRFALTREWDPNLPMVAFIGLNPSTADATKDDPTIRKCVGFARTWAAGGIMMLNLYAFRATFPRDLWAARTAGTDVVGEPAGMVRRRAEKCEMVIACWGNHGRLRGPHFTREFGRDMMCLGLNNDGSPRHPLMISYSSQLEPFSTL